jgi:NADH:ubiquinone oxidoreductase subunit F (NADH-binding)/NADH:ubiquinone oxidoreductase subunit E
MQKPSSPPATSARNRVFTELRMIQERCGGYIPEVELYQLAAKLQRVTFEKGQYIGGVCDVYSVASFYPEFRFKKPPVVEVRVCTALPCSLRGAEEEYRAIEAAAKGTAGVSVGRCPCLGRCDTAPAMTVNGHIFAMPDHQAGTKLADLAGQYIRWADRDAASVDSVARNVHPTEAAAEPPKHAHRLESLTGVPGVDEIGRQPRYAGDYRTDPYHEISEHYHQLQGLLSEKRITESRERAIAASKAPKNGALAGEMASSDADVESLTGVARVRNEIKSANLRGMGGAGKPFLRKFDQVMTAIAPEKYVVVNADESEPGTIKDRELMLRFPHLLIESLAIVGISVGAQKGYIYLRHEYEEQAASLLRELRWAYSDVARDSGGKIVSKRRFLGSNILGSGVNFDIELFISPGGYVMGEQSALLNAIEGQRGMPRNQIQDLGDKKGLPTGNGLWGMPTLVSNVETFTYLPAILHHGGKWFRDQGINGCQGLKWASVCGDVEKPGVFELSMGTTFREMIFEKAGGMRNGTPLKAFAPSGPSFGFLPGTDKFLDLPMDFPGEGPDGKANAIKAAGATVGSGAIIVLAEGRSVLEGALNFTRFFRNESCGKCVPCRIGSQKMVDVIKQIRGETYQKNSGQLAECRTRGEEALNDFVQELKGEHLETIERLSVVLESTSICGLGRVVHLPIQTVLKHFPDEVDKHLRGEMIPDGALKSP